MSPDPATDAAARSTFDPAHGRVQDVAAELAALAVAGPRALVSHERAAALWGIELLTPGAARITVPRNGRRRTPPGWSLVRSDVDRAGRTLRHGVPVTSALRTVRDLCRVLDEVKAVVAADSALRLGLVTLVQLQRDLGAADGRGADRLRRVAASVDPLAGSVLETLLRLLLAELRPAPRSQVWIREEHGRLVARVDFCWVAARLIVEADGFAFHSDRSAYRQDRERLNDLERLGWRVLRFTWEDVVGRPDHVLALVRECLHAA